MKSKVNGGEKLWSWPEYIWLRLVSLFLCVRQVLLLRMHHWNRNYFSNTFCRDSFYLRVRSPNLGRSRKPAGWSRMIGRKAAKTDDTEWPHFDLHWFVEGGLYQATIFTINFGKLSTNRPASEAISFRDHSRPKSRHPVILVSLYHNLYHITYTP